MLKYTHIKFFKSSLTIDPSIILSDFRRLLLYGDSELFSSILYKTEKQQYIYSQHQPPPDKTKNKKLCPFGNSEEWNMNT